MSVVSVVKTTGVDYASVKSAVDKALELLGGLEDVIKPGYKVLINPNLVAAAEDRFSGAVTRWEVTKAVAEAVKAIGATPIIAESAGAGLDTETVIRVAEYEHLREEGFEVVDLKSRPKAMIPSPGGVVCPELKTWDLVVEADAIITVPVMKTHDQTEVSLGMKNLKGLIRDENKKYLHFNGLVEGVADIVNATKPVLSVIDGTFGQMGIGPVYGIPIEMDMIIASKDIVANDAIASYIMGWDPDELVPITRAAYNRGLGEMRMENIEVRGEKLEDVRTRFKRSHEVEIEGLPEDFTICFAAEACTGCRNTLFSSLMDMKAYDLFEHLKGKIVCAGPVKPEDLPANANSENVICVGRCADKTLKDIRVRCAMGCPPGNVDTVQAILGPDIPYKIRALNEEAKANEE